MKKIIITTLLLTGNLVLNLFQSGTLNCYAQTWTTKTAFGGGLRYGATGFSISTKGYIGTGCDNLGNYYQDFWEWNQGTNTWAQKANFPGTARRFAVGFSIGTKGYIGTGFQSNSPFYNQDLWEWDGDIASPTYNQWIQKTNLPGPIRAYAVGFSIGTKGYIGTGYNNLSMGTTLKDFWEWDGDIASATYNQWSQKTDYPGGLRYGATGFSIGTKGYIGLGTDGSFHQDFWEWDQATGNWASRASFGGTPRVDAIGFSIGTKGYIGTGFDNTNALKNDFWEWDPSVSPPSGAWTAKTNFSGAGRETAVGFSIGTCGYIGTGVNFNISAYYSDFREWCSAVLPVEFLSFTGQPGDKNNIILKWETATESNNDYYILERGSDGKTFEEYGKVKGAGTTNINSNYSFTDKYPLRGINYYRLKQVDYDGNFSYSKIISINNQQINKSSVNIYPVPSDRELICEFFTEGDSEINITVIDVLGNIVMQEETKAKRGMNKSKLNIQNLSQGVYFLKMDNGIQQSQNKFIKQ